MYPVTLSKSLTKSALYSKLLIAGEAILDPTVSVSTLASIVNEVS